MRQSPESCFQIGDATVKLRADRVEDDPASPERGRGVYAGRVYVGGRLWEFAGIRAWDDRHGAELAVSLASRYSTGNRGTDTPGWAPPAWFADSVQAATAHAQKDAGSYRIRACRKRRVG